VKQQEQGEEEDWTAERALRKEEAAAVREEL
jgi:hypothetical protein